LGVAPTNPGICYATDCFRAYRTLDGGKHWEQVNSVKAGGNRWTTRGLDVTTCYSVHFDPFDPKHMFISYTDVGLFQSSDGGKSWTSSIKGIPENWENTTYWVEFDPKVKDLMWGAFAANHDLPRNKMWRRSDPQKYTGGVGISTDGGRSWTCAQMDQTACTHVLLDPTSPAGSRTLYACGFGRGVYKSTDNGKTWTLKNQGIEKDQPFAWRIVRTDDGTLYLIVACRAMKAPVGSTTDGALYKSTDGAETWTKVPMPEGQNFPTGMAIDPTDPKRIYLTTWGLFSMDGSVGGVFRSLDGGQTWKHVFSEGPHTYDVTLDPQNPKTLYICGFNSAAWRSTDGAETWTRLKGFNFKWGHRVVLSGNAKRFVLFAMPAILALQRSYED